jgi:IclR family pca regulon transcriptional regulator
MNDMIKQSHYFVSSLARGLKIIEAFGKSSNPLTLSEIARTIGTNKTTATRFCHTLMQLGYIKRDPQRRYHLTPRVLSLGYASIRSAGWIKVAQHYIEELSKEINETINLSMLDGSEIIYLVRAKTEKILPYDLMIGSKLPIYCTSMGKVLLAFGQEKKTQDLIAHLELNALTHHTITRKNDLLREIKQTRERGYAFSDEEFSLGLRSVAVPLFGDKPYALAAINIAVPTKRYAVKDLETALVPRLRNLAKQINRALKGMETLS